MSVVASSLSEPNFFSVDQLPIRLQSELGPVVYRESFLTVMSECLSFQSVLNAVKRVGFAPIISFNRIDRKICFTVVPYVGPAFFAKDRIEAPEGMRGEALWGVISAIRSLYKEGTPVIWKNKLYRDKLAFWGAFAQFASAVQIPSSIVVEAMEKYSTGSVSLDIGAGKGGGGDRALQAGVASYCYRKISRSY